MSGRGLAGMVALAVICLVLAVGAFVGYVVYTDYQLHHAITEVMRPW